MATNNQTRRARKWRANKLRVTLALCLIGTSLGACDDESSPALTSARCASGSLETDLEDSAWNGAGVDRRSGELRLSEGHEYVVSSTYGVPVPGADGAPVTEQYLQLFAAIQQQLESQTGLLAFKLSSSDACGSGRTLAVWESEEAMYDFVFSAAHTAAMKAADQVLKPGYGVTHWKTKSRSELTFAQGAKQLAQEANGD
jgi:heme-degrading monooxygenase HmoA